MHEILIALEHAALLILGLLFAAAYISSRLRLFILIPRLVRAIRKFNQERVQRRLGGRMVGGHG